jgi:hypothetical protein
MMSRWLVRLIWLGLLACSIVTLHATGAGAVTGTWLLHSTTETAVEVERSMTPCDSPNIAFRKIASLPAGTTSYVDPEVQSGTVACYRVRAVNQAGASPYTNAAESGSPEAPGDLTLAPTPGPAPWTFCSAEDAFCAFTGPKEVRYGADGAGGGYVSAVISTDGVPCNNATWTDPAYGLVKHCDYR